MALIKKCDVDDYFAAKRRARLHRPKSVGQPNASGPKQAGFAKDFLSEHSTPSKKNNPNGDAGRGAL
jgi:hypothetical protein